MELFSIVGWLVGIIVALAVLKILTSSVRFLLVGFLLVLAVVYFFGVSLTEVVQWVRSGLLWVF